MEDVEDAEMLLILEGVTTWEEAVVVHLEASTADQDVDAEEALALAAVVQTTGVLPVPCAPTAKEDLVPQLLAQDAILAVALVLLSPVHLAPL